jgi:hypothetical protein
MIANMPVARPDAAAPLVDHLQFHNSTIGVIGPGSAQAFIAAIRKGAPTSGSRAQEAWTADLREGRRGRGAPTRRRQAHPSIPIAE